MYLKDQFSRLDLVITENITYLYYSTNKRTDPWSETKKEEKALATGETSKKPKNQGVYT